MTGNAAPAWVREVDFSLVLHPQVMLTGNVRDWYRACVPPLPDASPAGSPEEWTTSYRLDLVGGCRRCGYAGLATLDPVSGTLSVRSAQEDPDVLRPFTRGRQSADQIAFIQAVTGHKGAPVGLVFPYAGRLFPAAGLPDPQLLELMGQIEALGHLAEPTPLPEVPSEPRPRPTEAGLAPLTPFNTIFWLCERQEDLHPAFPLSSRALRVVRVPVPALDARRAAAGFAMRD